MNEYIRVTEENEEDIIEIPIETDGVILLSTLSAQYQGVTGLKYKNNNTGAWRGIRLENGKLWPPDLNNWGNNLYYAVFPKDNKKRYESGSWYACADNSPTIGPTGNGNAKYVSEDNKKCCDLIILGLPWSADEGRLKDFFSKFGELVFAQIKRDASGKSKGFGFIRFAEYEAQINCLNQKHNIDGRICEVRVPHSKAGAVTLANAKIHVGRVTEDITAEDIHSYFAHYGKVVEVFVPKPCRGFAFVTFHESEVAQRLIGEDLIIKNTSVRISPANAQPWEGRGGGVATPSFHPHAIVNTPFQSAGAAAGHGLFMSNSHSNQHHPHHPANGLNGGALNSGGSGANVPPLVMSINSGKYHHHPQQQQHPMGPPPPPHHLLAATNYQAHLHHHHPQTGINGVAAAAAAAQAYITHHVSPHHHLQQQQQHNHQNHGGGPSHFQFAHHGPPPPPLTHQQASQAYGLAAYGPPLNQIPSPPFFNPGGTQGSSPNDTHLHHQQQQGTHHHVPSSTKFVLSPLFPTSPPHIIHSGQNLSPLSHHQQQFTVSMDSPTPSLVSLNGAHHHQSQLAFSAIQAGHGHPYANNGGGDCDNGGNMEYGNMVVNSSVSGGLKHNIDLQNHQNSEGDEQHQQYATAEGMGGAGHHMGGGSTAANIIAAQNFLGALVAAQQHAQQGVFAALPHLAHHPGGVGGGNVMYPFMSGGGNGGLSTAGTLQQQRQQLQCPAFIDNDDSATIHSDVGSRHRNESMLSDDMTGDACAEMAGGTRADNDCTTMGVEYEDDGSNQQQQQQQFIFNMLAAAGGNSMAAANLILMNSKLPGTGLRNGSRYSSVNGPDVLACPDDISNNGMGVGASPSTNHHNEAAVMEHILAAANATQHHQMAAARSSNSNIHALGTSPQSSTSVRAMMKCTPPTGEPSLGASCFGQMVVGMEKDPSSGSVGGLTLDEDTNGVKSRFQEHYHYDGGGQLAPIPSSAWNDAPPLPPTPQASSAAKVKMEKTYYDLALTAAAAAINSSLSSPSPLSSSMTEHFPPNGNDIMSDHHPVVSPLYSHHFASTTSSKPSTPRLQLGQITSRGQMGSGSRLFDDTETDTAIKGGLDAVCLGPEDGTGGLDFTGLRLTDTGTTEPAAAILYSRAVRSPLTSVSGKRYDNTNLSGNNIGTTSCAVTVTRRSGMSSESSDATSPKDLHRFRGNSFGNNGGNTAGAEIHGTDRCGKLDAGKTVAEGNRCPW